MSQSKEVSAEILLTVPEVELHRVVGNQQECIAKGSFAVFYTTEKGQQNYVFAQVGDCSWQLSKDIPALRSSDHIYTFFLVDDPAYYSIILAEDTPTYIIDILQTVLQNVTAYSPEPGKAYLPTSTTTTAPSARTALSPTTTTSAVAAAAQPHPTTTAGTAQAAVPVVTAGTAQAAVPVVTAGTAQAAVAPAPAGEVLPPGTQAAVGVVSGEKLVPPRERTLPEKVAGTIVEGGVIVSRCLMIMAKLAGHGIQKGAQWAVENIGHHQKEAQMSPEFIARLQQASEVASLAVFVTKGVATGAVAVTSHVASSLAGAVSQLPVGQRLTQDEGAIGTAKIIGGATLQAFAEIYEGMARAAQIVTKDATDATTKVIQHKYGDQAGEASKHGMDAINSVMAASLNLATITPKALVRTTAKKTAVTLLMVPHPQNPPSSQPSTSGVPMMVPGVNALGNMVKIEEVNDAQDNVHVPGPVMVKRV